MNLVNNMVIPSRVTGVISDLQMPGHLDNALEFCQDTFSDAKVKQIICIGDLIDHHYISFHGTEPDALNSVQEWKAVQKELQRWVKAFPKMFLCRGNHDDIPARQMTKIGMHPDIYLRDLNTIYGLPKSWVWSDQFTLFESCLVDHGLGSTGMYGAKNTANKLGCSYVQGHTHAYGATFDIPRLFRNAAAMNVGCLMDEDKYNGRYGKKVFKQPMSLGSGIIYAHDEMKFVPKR